MPETEVRRRFDKTLSWYQRISILLLLPALLTSFALLVGMISGTYLFYGTFSFIPFLYPAFAPETRFWLVAISFGILMVFIFLTLYAAKGRLWCFLLGAGLYAIDLVATGFLFSSDIAMAIVHLLIHLVILALLGLGLFFYAKAGKLLREHREEILD